MAEVSLNALDRLVRPRSVAIIGASSDPTKTTGRPSRYLQRHGYDGTTYLVNPNATEIDGLACYPSVSDLPGTPDVGLVLVGARLVPRALRDLEARGAGAAIVLAGGYAEVGQDGALRQDELRESAGSMRLLGPNTIGLVNLTDRTVISASVALEVEELPIGAVGLVSQSGGMVGAVLSRAAARGVGFSIMASTGNEADLEVSDLIEYLVDDPATRVIALYLEGLRHPDRFRVAAQRAASAGKPVVAYKVGRSEAGARSAASHTAALAGEDRVYDAFFEQCGVLRADTFADLIDVPAALVTRRSLGGDRIATLTSTGGGGVLVADACGVRGFQSPPPDAATAARLGAVLVGDGAVPDRNPIDVTLAGLEPEIFRSAITTLIESPSYDAIVVIVGSSALADPELAAGPIVACAESSPKPILAYVSPSAPHIVRGLNRQGVPAFDAPEGLATALAGMRRIRTAQPLAAASGPSGSLELETLPTGQLNERESAALFDRFGIPTARSAVIAKPEQAHAAAAQLGNRVVLKVLSGAVAHKSDLGGVVLDVHPDGAQDAATALLDRVRAKQPDLPIDGILVQEQIRDGVELILGCDRDPQFGPVLLLGAGGRSAELLQDTVLRLPPLSEADVMTMISQLRSYQLLTGYRGAPTCDLPALIAAIQSFALMVQALGDRLITAEINPLLVLPRGQGVRAVDGLVTLCSLPTPELTMSPLPHDAR